MSISIQPLSKDSKQNTVGVWIDDILDGVKGDVHVYTQQDVVVIGHNDNDAHMNFTPLCLVFGKNTDGTDEIRLQYADEKGDCKDVHVSEEVAKNEIKAMLQRIKNIAV